MRDFISTHGRKTLGDVARRLPPFRGKTRVVRVTDRALRALHPDHVELSVGSLRYHLDTHDLIDFSILYAGGYQSSLVRYLASRLGNSPSVFWDVGANVGSVSLPVASNCPNARVFSFEPSPAVYPRLAKNLALNPALSKRVTALQLALSDRCGEADFFVSNEPQNSGVGSLAHAHNTASEGTKVRVVVGTDLVRRGEAPTPDLIKVDVEGFEPEVLEGLQAIFESSSAIEVIFEHSLYRIDGRGRGRHYCVDFLRPMGFEFFTLVAGADQARPLAPDDLDRNCDIVARKGCSN